jgi:hypothetical protein
MLQKKLTRVLKIVWYNPRKWPETDVFAKRTCKLFWPGDIPLVLLCIKLWLVRGGGTVRVTKCIILASIWESNSRFQWQVNRPKRPETCTLWSKHKCKTSPNVIYKESVHIRGVAKKLTRVLKIVCYNQRKWPETDVFAKMRLQILLARRHTPGAVMD